MKMSKSRILLTALLVALMMLSASLVSGQSYNQSPMFDELVESGELPPVDERLPETPLMMETQEIGNYGGVWRRGFLGPADYNNHTRVVYDALVRFNATGDTVIPHLIEDLTANEEFTQWTMDMREGAKWSDGEDFTAEDIMFWYNGVALNEELSPSIPAWITNTDGSTATFEAPDDYTVVVTFDAPNTSFPLELANKDGADRTIAAFLPAHYMGQFHPDVADADALDTLVTEEGFNDWTELFIARAFPPDNPERPSMAAWVPSNGSNLSSQVFEIERNPYFVGVDAEGNQLPYIDSVRFSFFSDWENVNLAAAAGEVDWQQRGISVANLPVFLEQAEAGDYTPTNLPTFGGAQMVFFNMTYEDMQYRDLFGEHDFRRALSVAIDRSAINELVYLGLAEPRQPVPAPYHAYYPGDEFAQLHTEYDVDAANELLDSVGLDNRDSEGFRTFANGDRLELAIESAGEGAFGDQMELIAENWADIGIRTDVRLQERSLFYERANGNQHMLGFWAMDTSAFPFSGNPKTDPAFASGIADWGPLWIQWFQSDGELGQEPPENVKTLRDLHEQGRLSSAEEQVEIAQEIYRQWADTLYQIGIVGMTPSFAIVSDTLANVPETIANDWPLRTPGNAQPETWYFTEM